MTDTSVVFNVTGKDTGVGSLLGKVKGLFKSTGVEGAAAMKVVDHEVVKLDHDIKDAKDSLSALAREFAMASAGAERLQISRQMSRQSSDLGKLTKARNLIPDADVVSEGKSIGQRLSASITSGLGSLSPMTTAIGAAGLAAAPFIGATISAAVLGAAGVGGVVGGVMLAAQDSRVQSAWQQFAAGAKEELQDAVKPFVPATLSAIRTVRAAVTALGPDFKRIFASASTYLGPLTSGLTGFVSKFAAGFTKAVESAGPVIRVISDSLPRLGDELGNLFVVAAKHADEAAIAIGGIFKVMEVGIATTSTLVDWLSKAFALSHKLGLDFGARMLGFFNDAPEAIDSTTDSTLGFTAAVDDSADSTKAAADLLTSYRKALDDFTNSNLDSFDAIIHVNEVMAETNKTLKENKRNTDLSTKAGQGNANALSSLAKAFNAVTTSNDKTSKAASYTNAVYAEQRKKFVAAAIAAGYAKDGAEGLADSLLALPNSKTVTIKGNPGNAKAAISDVRAQLGGLPSSKTISIFVKSRMDKVQNQLDRLGARAAGGPVARGIPYLVGEEGPEIVVPDSNATVLSNSKTMASFSGGARTSNGAPTTFAHSGGGSSRTVRLELAGERALTELFRYLIRSANLIDGAIT